TYTLREITAPDGYQIATDVQFTVAEDGTVTEVVMKDVAAPTPSTPYTPSTPSSPPTGDAGANPLAFVMIGAGVLGLAIAMFMSRRKRGN
ncbi:MAG: prealbumin-like fold domain-containing protein, partial [Oscillospiraceae bacterium]|nr:prealbumin-like fold domain-containing protein [Oscillospiraceae bacterium]